MARSNAALRKTDAPVLRAAIVTGERDGRVLGSMKNARIRASVDEIARSLQGNWRVEHLFALKQALGAFDFVGTPLAECEREIERQLQDPKLHDGNPAKGKKRGRARNAPKFDLRTILKGFGAHRLLEKLSVHTGCSDFAGATKCPCSSGEFQCFRAVFSTGYEAQISYQC